MRPSQRLADVKQNAREALAVWLDKKFDDIDVTVSVTVPKIVQSSLDEARKLQRSERETRACRQCNERSGAVF